MNDVKDEVDLEGYSHALRDNDIRHIRNSHGENTNEKYPVTENDIKDIPYIVENYDKVYVVPRDKARVGLVYVKRKPDGLTYYVEQVTEKYGNEKLLVNKQMIKTGVANIPNLKGLKEAITKKQSESEFLDDLKNAPQVYVQDVYQNRSNTSIDSDDAFVKTAESFSLSSPVEKTDTLVAIHNMDEEKLRRTLDLGAWPSPSIAIVEAEQGHADYGEYSAVFPRETIDPEADTRNRVYDL